MKKRGQAKTWLDPKRMFVERKMSKTRLPNKRNNRENNKQAKSESLKTKASDKAEKQNTMQAKPN